MTSSSEGIHFGIVIDNPMPSAKVIHTHEHCRCRKRSIVPCEEVTGGRCLIRTAMVVPISSGDLLDVFRGKDARKQREVSPCQMPTHERARIDTKGIRCETFFQKATRHTTQEDTNVPTNYCTVRERSRAGRRPQLLPDIPECQTDRLSSV
jgi:hypothetical protein